RGGRIGSVTPNTEVELSEKEPETDSLFTDNSNEIIPGEQISVSTPTIAPPEPKDNLYVDDTDEDNFFDDFFYDEN
ncbi:MAG: hypothetical protein IKI04_03280, partial [Bacilli bacterium]|nr:hypothetical protein [Bacilli bacterium]